VGRGPGVCEGDGCGVGRAGMVVGSTCSERPTLDGAPLGLGDGEGGAMPITVSQLPGLTQWLGSELLVMALARAIKAMVATNATVNERASVRAVRTRPRG
jgi:hypothetical protein